MVLNEFCSLSTMFTIIVPALHRTIGFHVVEHAEHGERRFRLRSDIAAEQLGDHRVQPLEIEVEGRGLTFENLIHRLHRRDFAPPSSAIFTTASVVQ